MSVAQLPSFLLSTSVSRQHWFKFSGSNPGQRKLLNKIVFARMVDHEHKSDPVSGENKLYILMERGDCDLDSVIQKLVKHKSLTPAKLRFYWEEMLEVTSLAKSGLGHPVSDSLDRVLRVRFWDPLGFSIYYFYLLKHNALQGAA